MKILDFEQPIANLEQKIEELKNLSNPSINIMDEINILQSKADKLLKQTYQSLNAWQKVQIARHQDRPKFFDYLNELIEDFIPLAGDRCFGEDLALIGGFGKLKGRSVMIMGHQKGTDTESRVKHSFGMAKPEGYRKAQRLMKLADRFNLPIITFVDTAGAYPGIEAEERGQAEAIAASIQMGINVKVPILTIVIGEGGSGGAIAIATGNHIMMLEHSIYSVISPEGCASILWRSSAKASEASEAQKLTAQDLLQLQLIDKIIPEPVGGAHRFPQETIKVVCETIHNSLETLIQKKMDYRDHRRQKFLQMGQVGL
ncbi:MAG: acetyl-CoA carboxylase carboxyl transferase subunit alpha [Candidatus Puniceispirillum sp.]|nr:acetyl-CoA carboxylase carboxyl transferase subunit alpha [Candidatus Pelagibacter sp.]MBA4283238.1 acetyl-CoA carboxylase carboxyl transferase subunit alpha [Candidatus Puniceispirillum sp.]